MDIIEAFGRVINISFNQGIDNGLVFLDLSKGKIEEKIKKKKFLIAGKNYDIILDFKPKIKQLNIYLSPKKWSKKLLKSLQKTEDFKAMVILIGKIDVLKNVCELRIGAFGVPSSDLVRAIIKYKKK